MENITRIHWCDSLQPNHISSVHRHFVGKVQRNFNGIDDYLKDRTTAVVRGTIGKWPTSLAIEFVRTENKWSVPRDRNSVMGSISLLAS